jgi:iron complex outermembrane receptor protein
MWIPHLKHRFWASVSKATRTPSRLEHDMNSLAHVIPPLPPATPAVALFYKGNRQFDSEQVVSYEFGYRTTLIEDVSIDFTAFYNDYSDLRSVESGTPVFNPATGVAELSYSFNNNSRAQTYGFEIATVWQMLDWWRWDANYSLLKTDFDRPGAESVHGHSPQQHVSLRSTMSPRQDIDLDILFRYVDRNKAIGFFGSTVIDDYVSMDIRLAWRPVNNIELSLVGQNLLAKQHLEYQQEILTAPTEIDRGVYGKLTWQF